MKVALLLALALPLALLDDRLPLRRAAGEGEAVEGFVMTAGAGKLTINANDGKQRTFEIGPTAIIMIHGKLATLDELEKAMHVRVTTDPRGTVLEVSTIDAEKRRIEEPIRFDAPPRQAATR